MPISVFRRADEHSLEAIAEEKKLRKTGELFLLFGLGSITDFLIYQRVSRLGVHCLWADPATVRADDVAKLSPAGIILSGGHRSVCDGSDQFLFDCRIFDLGIPTLGICLGFQLWAKHLGIGVRRAPGAEYGPHRIRLSSDPGELFAGAEPELAVFQNHRDEVLPAPCRLFVAARSENGIIAAGQYGRLYGVQFHPEVSDTPFGPKLFENFVFGICGAKDRFPAKSVAEQKVGELRRKIGAARVLLNYSGGSDSSVALELLGRAVGYEPGRIRALYIAGLDLRDNERRAIDYARKFPWLDFKAVSGSGRFLDALRGISDGGGKREAVRGVYCRITNEEIDAFGASYIVQGTLYTDISESGCDPAGSGGEGPGARKSVIKKHHNVGNRFAAEEIMPLADQVKDTGRSIGRELGVPEERLTQHPCPGPGLAIRIGGEVTDERLEASQVMHEIWIGALRESGRYEEIWQAGVDLLDAAHTAHRGDQGDSGQTAMLWALSSENGFTARPYPLPLEFLEKVSVRIANSVPLVVAAGYRTMPKPPATIEQA